MAINYIWHVNVNCSNLERSKAFYELLGFKSVWELDTEEIRLTLPSPKDGEASFDEGLGAPGIKGKAHIMMLHPDEEQESRLDLIEWEHPRDPEPPYSHLVHLGINRICLGVDGIEDIQKEYKRLGDAGVEFVSPIVRLQDPSYENGEGAFVMMKDPDGTIIELMTTATIPD